MSEFTITEANEFPWERALPALGELLLRHIQRTGATRPVPQPTTSVPHNPAPVTFPPAGVASQKWSKTP